MEVEVRKVTETPAPSKQLCTWLQPEWLRCTAGVVVNLQCSLSFRYLLSLASMPYMDCAIDWAVTHDERAGSMQIRFTLM